MHLSYSMDFNIHTVLFNRTIFRTRLFKEHILIYIYNIYLKTNLQDEIGNSCSTNDLFNRLN